MSIQIKLYSFSKKENSTLIPQSNDATMVTYDCVIKTPSSLMTPIVELNITGSNPTLKNYARIPDFNRYYFITDWKFDRGLWYAYLMVDVLGSFLTSIGALSMYILRSSKQSNGYIKDMMYPITGNVSYDSTIFESGAGIGYKDGYFVVTTVGSSNNAGQTIWQMNATEFNNVLDQLMATASGNVSWGGLAQGLVNSLLNPTDYIVSAFWFPKKFSTASHNSGTFTCGLWSSGVTVDIIDNVQVAETYLVDIPKHPQANTRGKYLNLAPFTEYELDLGFIRTIPLDTTKLVDVSQILVSLYIDPMTGVAVVEGRTVTANDQMQLFKLSCNYGVPINIAMGKNNIINALAQGAEALPKVALGDVKTALEGVAELASATSSAIGTVSNSGSVGSLSGHKLPKRLFSKFFEVADEDNDNLGRPLCQKTTPNALLGGYILAKDCDIKISWATKGEIDRIKAYVTSGFFYELLP